MADLAALKSKLDAAARPLPGVAERRLFGCDGYFAGGSIFALVWKEGRLGVRLPDGTAHAEAMALPGATPWSPGGKMTIQHWVLLPQAVERSATTLARWVQRAHALAAAGAGAPKSGKAATVKAASTKAASTKTASAKAASPKTATAKPARAKSTKAASTKTATAKTATAKTKRRA